MYTDIYVHGDSSKARGYLKHGDAHAVYVGVPIEREQKITTVEIVACIRHGFTVPSLHHRSKLIII